jgi:two-component system, NtrC family, sensor histidine kinase HydH
MSKFTKRPGKNGFQSKRGLLEMALNRLSFLTQLINLFTSTVAYEERLDNFVNLIARNFNVELTLFFGLDKSRAMLFLSADSRRIGTRPRLDFVLGQGIVGEIAQKRTVVVIQAQDPEFSKGNETLLNTFPDSQTLAGFPVADDNFLYGVLLFIDKASREFSQHEQETIMIACRMLAGNIRQALLHEEAKKRIAELAVLFDVAKSVGSTMELNSILERVVSISAKVLNARGASLRIVDEQSQHVHVSSEYGVIPKGISSSEILACQKSFSENGSASITSEINGSEGTKHYYAGIPLNLKGNLKGMLCLFDKMTPNHRYQQFDSENIQLLQTLAGMASSSIENALAFHQIEALATKNERMVNVLTVLHDITSVLMTTIDLNKILAILVHALTMKNGMDFDRAVIFLVDTAHNHLVEANHANQQPISRPALPIREALIKSPAIPAKPTLIGRDPIRILLQKDQGIVAQTVLLKKPFHILNANSNPEVNQQVREKLTGQEFVTVPLLAKEDAIGVILVDNNVSKRPLKDEDVHFLTMFANQAALAIENSRLVETIEASSKELTLIRERMLESDRLAAMSSMAEGLAHEIRNPLVSIGGFARRISRQVGPEDALKQYVDVIVDEVGRLEKILRQMFDYTGDALGYFQEHEINKLVEDALTLIYRDLEKFNIQVEKEYAELPPVYCDERQIKLVFYNIFQNAQQAMEKGGILTIRTFPLEKSDGLYAAVSVSDTGGGIAPELVYNIFNPFFTTKEQGTGLGLSIAQRIVSRHYGDIEINNELGRGITFTVTLPIAKYCLIPPGKVSPAADSSEEA